MSATSGTARVPTVEDEARFWELVEAAWARLPPAATALRRALRSRDPELDDGEEYEVDAWLDPFLAELRELCAGLSARELTDLDRVLERKLFDLDRADVQEVTDGSDDGFLYARGWIVALGREYHEAVAADPALAVPDAECEEMCYLFAHLHEESFGEWPETGSGISRETGGNEAGWATAPADAA
ncbi:DUF4240 domain-containing protein [Micromonospora sp. NPDC000089]|uniref:DUF4240 domain-containing protein n=1 Tax=unclassified Micromonospora TaxID=2617518 RepID=UPI003690D7DA